MSRVYTARLFRAPSYSGPPFVFLTVPTGFRAVVKTIAIVVGTNLVDVEAWVEDDEGGKLAVLAQNGTPPFGPTTGLFYGTWAFEPGETLAPATNGITADFHVTGFLLTLP